MKINSIRISNLLSFEYKPKIDQCENIYFKDGINVIIGPNGSGKSNFLEILNKFFNNVLIQAVDYTDSHIRSFEIGKKSNVSPNFRGTIKRQSRDFNVPKNNASPSKPSSIQIEIGLTKNDIDNLSFIHENLKELSEFGSKYCEVFPNFPIVELKQIKNLKSIILNFEDVGSGNLTSYDSFTDIERFAYFYINHFNTLQYLIEISDRRERKEWGYLKNTFGILNSLRNYDQIESIVQIQSNEVDIIHNAKINLGMEDLRRSSDAHPRIFGYLFNKLGYSFHHHVISNGIRDGYDPISDFGDELFLKINEILKDVLGLKIHISIPDTNSLVYHFNFIEIDTGKTILIPELSAGEKGIIHFIFSIYGYDLFNGVMIIDEPEIHMHPQMQDLCLYFMKKMANEGMQFIISTHSPIFVTSETIDGVKRFYKGGGFSKSISPVIAESEKNLIRILTLTNSSKIFFSKKVILVEGDSDEYFYKTYFGYYEKNKQSKLKGFEFLKIDGRGSAKMWIEFLQKYEIMTYYIGDTDNLMLDYFSKNAKRWRTEYGTKLLRSELTNIKQNHSSDHAQMMLEISNLFPEKIFLLSNGSLEDYLEPHIVKKPEFEDVISFCNSFDSWIKLNASDPIIEESRKIFDNVTN